MISNIAITYFKLVVIVDLIITMQNVKATTIQKWVRCRLCALKYKRMKSRTIIIQALARGKLVRFKIAEKTRYVAATLIQAMVRGENVRYQIRKMEMVADCSQAVTRGFLVRQRKRKMEMLADFVPPLVRGFLARRRVTRMRQLAALGRRGIAMRAMVGGIGMATGECRRLFRLATNRQIAAQPRLVFS